MSMIVGPVMALVLAAQAVPEPTEITPARFAQAIQGVVGQTYEGGVTISRIYADGQIVVIVLDGPVGWRSTTSADAVSTLFIDSFCKGRDFEYFVNGNQMRVDTTERGTTSRLGPIVSACPSLAVSPRPPVATNPPPSMRTSLGTGFFVGPTGYVLTSYHVVIGANEIDCRTGDGTMHPATVIRASQVNDLVLLQVGVRPLHYLGLAPRGSIHPGDRVFTIGYGAPSYLGVNEPRFTEGAISALSGPNAEDSWMQITVPIQPGNSGGPVVNESGQVVGIIAATAATQAFVQLEGVLPQSINWAVKADYAASLLPSAPPPPIRTRPQAIAQTRGAICLIVARSRDEAGR